VSEQPDVRATRAGPRRLEPRCDPEHARANLDRDSVANVAQIMTLDRIQLGERIGRISKRHLELIFAGLDLVLGR
jgi:mRNA-degrading endonuclease toxin of MazEF toxin-antitoxin module